MTCYDDWMYTARFDIELCDNAGSTNFLVEMTLGFGKESEVNWKSEHGLLTLLDLLFNSLTKYIIVEMMKLS